MTDTKMTLAEMKQKLEDAARMFGPESYTAKYLAIVHAADALLERCETMLNDIHGRRLELGNPMCKLLADIRRIRGDASKGKP